MSEKVFAIVLLIGVAATAAYNAFKPTPPTVQPAPEVTTTTSTANEQDANVLVVPSLIHTPLPSIVTESQALVPVAVEAPYTPAASPPARSAGRWVTVQRPVYGRFGRFRGYEYVRRWQKP